ncbi:MAG: thioredoxin family protein [Planctomycetes bacterium]|nr:thioredoxin family protein [Planctomycetota bacterium]
MPQINKFYEKNKDSGLHIINILAQKAEDGVWDKYHADNGIQFTGTYFEGNNFEKYFVPKRLPQMYVIGTDGEVKFSGGAMTGLSWMKTAAKELKKVEYPFIGMRDVPKELSKPAQYLSDGMFGKAHIEATKIAEKSEDQAVIEYAEKIIDSIESRIDAKFDRVRTLNSLRRYHESVELLEYLSGDACKGLETVEDAKEELQEIAEDEDAQLELKAWKALSKVLKKSEKAKDSATKRKVLAKFVENNSSTAAAEEATMLAGKIK